MQNGKLMVWILAGALGVGSVACGGNGTDDDDVVAGQILNGSISQDTKLTNLVEDPTKPDYYVQGDVLVKALLTIEPGVVLEFAPGTQLTIDGRSNGKLDTNGTKEAPVVFTGKDKTAGSWQGVYIDNSLASQNRVNWTIIEYGGGKAFGSGLDASNLGIGGFVGKSTVSVTNSTFRHSKAHGLEMEPESSFGAFTDNNFEANQGYAMRISPEHLASLDGTTTFASTTGKAGVEVVQGSVIENATWKKLKDAAPIFVTGDILVQSKLTIEPGVALHFDSDKILHIDGRKNGVLSAKGSATDNILMTRMENASWKGVFIDNSTSSANVLEHVTIEYGGSAVSEREQKANLTIGGFVGNSTIEIKDCTFGHSKGYGIAIKTDSTVNADVETVNSFIDNASGDVHKDY